MNAIHLSNTSQPLADAPKRKGLQYYDWKVFVDEDEKTLDEIDSVTYILHPTFPEPVRTIKDPSTGFALETKGWGEFQINARIHFKDGSTSTASHMLDLGRK